MAKKGPIIFGVGAVLAALGFLLGRKPPELPEPPPNGIVVALWNPPKEATMWTLTLTDWNITVPIREVSGKDRLDIAEIATFEIPSGASFPLRVAFLQLTKWIEWEGTPALQQLYYAQSIYPYLWDWDEMDWGDEADPTYKEAFIPDYGSYYYNVAKERFEKA